MGQANLGKVRGDNGASVYIRYNYSASDMNATCSRSDGQKYIGVQTSADTSSPETGYVWTKLAGDDGNNCYIKYNTSASDSGATDTWSTGQNYIGFALSAASTAPPSGYTWRKFAYSNTDLLGLVYPVGAVYISTNSTSPASFVGGEWVQIAGRVLVGVGTSDQAYAAGGTGGESKHTLTVDEIPPHKHSYRGQYVTTQAEDEYIVANTNWGANWIQFNEAILNSGGGTSHNNMPPYYVVYMWRRTL
jgi:hypothetical protein